MRRITITLVIWAALLTPSRAGLLREVWEGRRSIDEAVTLARSGTSADRVDILEHPEDWADIGDDSVRRYCYDEGIEVLAEIPDIRAVAEAYAQGVLAAEVSQHYRSGFERLLDKLTSPTKAQAT